MRIVKKLTELREEKSKFLIFWVYKSEFENCCRFVEDKCICLGLYNSSIKQQFDKYKINFEDEVLVKVNYGDTNKNIANIILVDVIYNVTKKEWYI